MAVNNLRIQVEVLTPRANSPDEISLTKLEGVTAAFNAPDAKAYTMSKNFIFSSPITDPASYFASLPTGINHLVISSQGGMPSAADASDLEKLALFIGSFKATSVRIDISNVEQAFKTLKSKLADNAVIWISGCNIAANTKLCSIAAKTAGCHVVAPVNPLLNKSYPPSKVDILDRFAGPVIFAPKGNHIKIAAFCAQQEQLKFVIPV